MIYPLSLYYLQGCDASVVLSVNPGGGQTERDAPPNNPSLHGFEVVDAARATLEQSCPRTVSCTDILAFAARESVNLTGSPRAATTGASRLTTARLASLVQT